MRSTTFSWVTAMTLFAVLALAVQLPAQESTEHFRHYKLIDLATFGGPASYINPPFALGSPTQISNRGIAVGSASTDTPTTLFPSKEICGGVDGIVPLIFHAFAWQNGAKKDLGALGALPADECSEAVSINANGEIAGRSGNGVIDPLVDVEEIRAVVWRNGEIKDLGTLGGSHSIATAINNRAQVVGFSVNTIPDPFSLLYALGGFTNGTQTRGFLWHEGHMRDLGTLGGPDAQAFALNERGQAAGISYIDSAPNPITGLPTADPFLWSEDGGMVDLGTLGGVWGGAGPLNNRGQVIGVSSVAADPGACVNTGGASTATCHPFFWDHGKLIDLNTDTTGGNPNSANALNDAGEVVGNANFTDGAVFGDAYLWKDGVIRDLGTGDCYSEAFAINARGQVVGQSGSCLTHTLRTILWENDSIVDLNALASPKGLQLVEAFAITDDGVIGGIGVPPGCSADDACGHAYVLIPVCPNGTQGCADAPLDPAAVAQSRSKPGAGSETMTPEEVATFKERIARMRAEMAGHNRGFGLWSRR